MTTPPSLADRLTAIVKEELKDCSERHQNGAQIGSLCAAEAQKDIPVPPLQEHNPAEQARRYLEARYGRGVWFRAPETFGHVERWIWALASHNPVFAHEIITEIEDHFRELAPRPAAAVASTVSPAGPPSAEALIHDIKTTDFVLHRILCGCASAGCSIRLLSADLLKLVRA